MSLPGSISHAVQQTQTWLKELRDTLDLADEAQALAVLRAVLHQLRDRLAVDESVQFAAQLPLIVRGIYFEGWVPSRVPDKSVRTEGDFIDAVKARLLPYPLPADAAVQAVFTVLAHHLDPGEISDVIDQLPDPLKRLWPLTARTFKERMR